MQLPGNIQSLCVEVWVSFWPIDHKLIPVMQRTSNPAADVSTESRCVFHVMVGLSPDFIIWQMHLDISANLDPVLTVPKRGMSTQTGGRSALECPHVALLSSFAVVHSACIPELGIIKTVSWTPSLKV